jgi:2-polyprenyl-3-methyl-5-hydroxy-6-metoxy-1,4-benzoquinol methylase
MNGKMTEIDKWDPKTIQLFWDYTSKRTDLFQDYFSYQIGRGIVNFLQFARPLQAEAFVLDYGCGPGFLIEHLLTLNARITAIDTSQDALDFVNKKFQGLERWVEAIRVPSPPAPFADGTFDVVICVELLEHLLDSMLPAVVKEIHRLLKPGGLALISTPNDEDLTRSQILCPFCRTEFHKVQHLRSFSEKSMRQLLEAHGFRVIFCQGVDLSKFQREIVLPSWKDLSFRVLSHWIKSKVDALVDQMHPRPFPRQRVLRAHLKTGPHLCAIVERPHE